jgi:hypothetical protein
MLNLQIHVQVNGRHGKTEEKIVMVEDIPGHHRIRTCIGDSLATAAAVVFVADGQDLCSSEGGRPVRSSIRDVAE